MCIHFTVNRGKVTLRLQVLLVANLSTTSQAAHLKVSGVALVQIKSSN